MDISTATSLTLRARGMGTSQLITGSAVIVDDGSEGLRGRWSYAWSPGDTEVVDIYDVEFIIVHALGEIEVVPSSGHGQFKVAATL